MRGGTPLFYVVVASLIMPSIVVSLGIGLLFRLVDTAAKGWLEAHAPGWVDSYTTAMGMFTNLTDEQLRAVVEYVKFFSRKWRKAENYAPPIELPKAA